MVSLLQTRPLERRKQFCHLHLPHGYFRGRPGARMLFAFRSLLFPYLLLEAKLRCLGCGISDWWSVCGLEQEPFQDVGRNTVRWSGARPSEAHGPKATHGPDFGKCQNFPEPPAHQGAGKNCLTGLLAGTEELRLMKSALVPERQLPRVHCSRANGVPPVLVFSGAQAGLWSAHSPRAGVDTGSRA